MLQDGYKPSCLLMFFYDSQERNLRFLTLYIIIRISILEEESKIILPFLCLTDFLNDGAAGHKGSFLESIILNTFI